MAGAWGRLLGAGSAVLLVAALLAGTRAGAAPSGPRYKEIVTKVAPGLTLTKIVEPKVPRRTFVLSVDLTKPLTMDVGLAFDRIGKTERTTSIASRHGAIAAVNGDFWIPSSGPVHPFAEDGDLKKSSEVPGIGFAVSVDEQQVFIARPDQAVGLVEVDTGETWTIDTMNDGPPGLGEIAAYSPTGGTAEVPPAYACSARLLTLGSPRLKVPEPGVERDFSVDQVGCSAEPMTTNGGVVLAAKPASDEALRLLSLTVGETVRATWSFGWPGVFDSIGGVPLLVSHGEVAVEACDTAFCRRNPRTGVGVTSDGHLLLVVVDGRQPKKYSIGMGLVTFAQLFVDRGALWAMNLDGGGSSTMVVNGEVVNRPSDESGERPVQSALLVLPGPDDGEIPPAIGAGASGPGRAVLLDPGSTGGMLDALARGAWGSPLDLSKDLQRALELFRERFRAVR